jgi:hypothetical protein
LPSWAAPTTAGNAKHHFSFANYYDPTRMGWGAAEYGTTTRSPRSQGFAATCGGAITAGTRWNTGRTEAGDVRVMSAGSGVRILSEDATTRLFQIGSSPRTRRQAVLGREAVP